MLKFATPKEDPQASWLSIQPDDKGVRENRVLIVDGKTEHSELLPRILIREGFQPYAARSLNELNTALEDQSFELIVLGSLLPEAGGLSLCRQIRQKSRIPLVMIISDQSDIDGIACLDAGADDVLARPYNITELVARIRAILRRTLDQTFGGVRRYSFNNWKVDLSKRQLHSWNGAPVILTSLEFDLLVTFCKHPGQILSREDLLTLAHASPVGSMERSIDVHISRLRQKIETNSRKPEIIKTVRLAGYVFAPDVRSMV